MDMKYVRQRRARKIIAASGSACAGTATIIAVVALLAQRPGAFVVSLDNSASRLSLGTNPTSSEQVTYMNAGELPNFVEYENESLNLFSDESLDSQLFNYRVDASTREGTIKFFTCTFYVKNVGEVDAAYSLSLNFTSITKSKTEGYGLDSILRVRFYENKVTNDGNETHKYRVFAKPSTTRPHEDEEGNTVYTEQISIEGSGYAEAFESQYRILTSNIDSIAPNEAYRYTFVFWLEGNDPDSFGKKPPLDSNLNLGVSISAHEATEEQNS